ncbi:hypothetical protein [Rhizobium leguminosarum]|uniref:hypothetical protein n=1 Tax=Rhizobium leguminosarum TaxID=384 RepID=UPI003F9646C0
MSRLLEETGQSLPDLVAFVNCKLFSVVCDLLVYHSLDAESLKRPSIALWPSINEEGGELNVHISFGDATALPPEASEDGLIRSFATKPSYKELARAVSQLQEDWGSAERLTRMLRKAHPRLSADRQRILGVAA